VAALDPCFDQGVVDVVMPLLPRDAGAPAAADGSNDDRLPDRRFFDRAMSHSREADKPCAPENRRHSLAWRDQAYKWRQRSWGHPGGGPPRSTPIKGWNEERGGPSTPLGTAGLSHLCNLSRIVTVKVGGAHRGRGLQESVVLRRPRQGLHPDERAALLVLME
jgi:hypothetical protein